jgi:hypothetical protein
VWKVLQYYVKYQSARGVLGAMPAWARFVLLMVALPGLCLLSLSFLALVVSLLALLLLTVPVYRLLKSITGVRAVTAQEMGDAPLASVDFVEPADAPAASNGAPSATVETTLTETVELTPTPPRRQIDVRIVE